MKKNQPETSCELTPDNSMFLFGGSFAPLALDSHIPMDQWEKGMRQMKKFGFNAYRAFVSWNRIERKEGIRDFTELDYSLDLAAKHGIRVTLNLGGVFHNLQGFRPPPWLAYKYLCQHKIDNPEMALAASMNNPDMLLCNDDPIYHKKAGDFMRDVVKRYAKHPALECWALWNEPGGNPCYCPHTVKHFQDWLRKRYDSLTALNDNWGTLFPIDFQSWEAVRPAFPATTHVCKAQRLDWLEFCEDHFIEEINWIADIVKSIDPIHTTSLNVMGVHARDFSTINMDQAGISAYVEKSPYNPRRTYSLINVFMESARSGRRCNEKIRIIETDSGPRPASRRAGSQVLAGIRDWSFIALGANVIFSFIYRTRVDGGHACQASMTAWDGSDTQRLCIAGQRAAIIHKNSDRILKAHPFPGQIGVLHDMKMYRMSQVENTCDLCMASHDNSMMLLKDAGFSIEYLMDSHLFSDTLSRFKAIFIPFCPNINEKIAAALKKYVAHGGVLIAESYFGIKDHYFVQKWPRTPGCGLDEVFGFSATDAMLLEDDDKITLKDGRIIESASDFKMDIKPGRNAEILGSYADGSPAVIGHRYKQGATLFLGSIITSQYAWKDKNTRNLVREFIEKNAQINPLFKVQSEFGFEDITGNVGIYPVTADNNIIEGIYIVNYNKETLKFRIGIDTQYLGDGAFLDIISGKKHIFINNQDAGFLDIEIAGQTPIALFRRNNSSEQEFDAFDG